MAQITSGVRAILSSPVIYDSMQKIMGAETVRRELVEEFIRPGVACKILDIGCGTAEILNFLPSDVEYWGFYISAEYIDAAKRRYGNRGNFHCGLIDVAKLSELPKFDRVLALGVLHHLNDDEAGVFFEIADRALNANGRVVSFDPCFSDDQNSIAKYLISKDRGQNVRNEIGYRKLAKRYFPKVKGVLRHRIWIPYTHWFMECEK